MAGTFPLWQNITPSEVIDNEETALKVVSGLRHLLGRYSGIPAISSLVYSGLNWDFPNSWPPHLCKLSLASTRLHGLMGRYRDTNIRGTRTKLAERNGIE